MSEQKEKDTIKYCCMCNSQGVITGKFQGDKIYYCLKHSIFKHDLESFKSNLP